MNRGKKVKKNILYGFLNQFIIKLLAFVTRTLFIQYIGIEYLGINTLFSEILSFLAMADLGLNTAMLYSFYRPLAKSDNEELAGLVHFYKKIYRCIALSVLVIGLSFLPFLDGIINIKQDIPNIHLYYILFVINSSVSYLFVYKTTLINANQMKYILANIQLVTSIVQCILQIIVIVTLQNYLVYLLIMISVSILNNMLGAYQADRIFPFLKIRKDIDKKQKKEIIFNVKSAFICRVSGVFLNSTDNIIMSVLFGAATVGIYSNYALIIQTINSFMLIIFSAVTVGIGNMIVVSDNNAQFKVFKKFQKVDYILGFIIISCLSMLLQDFIRIWLGANAMLSDFTVQAIIINFYLTFIFQPIWSFGDATGIYRKTKYMMVVTALLNIFLSFLLGVRIGVGGVILASAFSRLVTCFWYEPFILFRDHLKQSVFSFFKSTVSNSAIITIYILVLNEFIKKFDVVDWKGLIIKGATCSCLSVFFAVVIYLKVDELKSIMQFVKRNARKKTD